MAEDLILLQTELFERLQKAERNYKKSPKERITQAYIETKLQTLEELWQEFKSGHNKIVVAVTPAKKATLDYFTEDTYDIFEEQYTSYKSTLKTAIQRFSKGGGQHKSHESMSQTTEVKLPRIQLPTFTGKYDEWQSFYDMFVSLIHDNVTLSGVQKLHYLKANLSGEPEKLLRNFPTTEQNYEEAWKLLTKRYNNIRYNTNAILTNLFTQKQITNPSSNSVKQLLDTTTSCLKSLNNLGIKTHECDVFIVYLVVSKLDPESHRLWEQQLSALSDTLPTWSLLVDFLECRFRSLEMIDAGKHTTKPSPSTDRAKHTNKAKSFHSAVQEEPKKYTNAKCILCDGQHYLYHCKLFEQQPTTERVEFVQKHQLCFNCMSPNHVVHKCRQSACCRKCGRRHHTMLHYENRESLVEDKTKERSNTHSQNQNEKSNSPIAHTSNNETRIVANFSSGDLHSYSVLLATAVINAHSRQGERYLIRALLDQGSQASFVSESTVQLLKLKRIPVNGLVSGLGEGHTRVKYMVSLKLESRHNPEIIHNVNAYVLGTLTSLLPSERIESSQWLELESLPLADPDFAKPGKIDVLLGAEVYSEILLNNMIKNSKGNLIAQNTVFGWVISGRVLRDDAATNRVVSMHVQMRDDDWLKHFWEIEAEPNSVKRILTKEEMKCEKYYEETTVRDENGRFIVRLPFKDEKQECTNGESKQIAMRRLLYLEKQLNKNPNLRREYERVIGEYSTLNHMEPVQQHEIDYPRAVYLPHHPVVREDKETTQVRVVMNASSKGTNGVSLNDDLLVGPRLQQDLRHILMRWREHPICIVADIIKMYRQVLVHKDDAEFQRILWRSDASLPIQHFRLITLTFGTACAPYLAVKTLQKLAEVEASRYPKASEITKSDYFVDDLMTGCVTETEAIEIYNEMNQLMNSGGFNLQKWSSNSDQLLQYIGRDKHSEEQTIPIKSDTNMKVLGIKWNRQTDHFEYAIMLPESKEPITKRQILSDIARIYDPLGWIAPVVICAKIIMQKVWKNQLDWDEELSDNLLHVWLRFRNDLEDVKNITVPRWIQCNRDCNKELHAFSDASTAGYAAAVYLRVVDKQGNIHVSLVSAKTKVAPIEKEVSIPRLELCGAVLAAKLLSEISQVMNISKQALFGWTDSTIVLAWLKGGPSRWNTFVSNRVSEILTIIEYEQWGHVATETNPADCASRGLRPAHLRTHTLWWNGPSWLSEPRVERDNGNVPETHEEEKIKTFNIVSEKKEEFEWTRFSKLSKMLRIISYCRRFLSLRKPREERENRTNYITTEEIKKTLEGCIKQAQELEFEEEIKSIKSKGHVPKKSVLHTLCPFLDKSGILRVGGRIEKAHASYDKRHPIIIPAKSHLTQLLIADAHDKTLHGGPQIMQNFLRSTYWILRARNQTKKYFRQCVTCLRYSKTNRVPLMGQLPEVRLKPSKPFKATGVDYAGPINIRFSPGRGSKSYKGYICIFICMVTRAIHIEAVSDLTTKGFIAAFRRFTARRGHCQDIYSDNGTNFVGAEREFRDMFNNANSKLHNEVAQAVTHENTNWHFIPPHAPNFGGLWEAGVRSIKTHLKKVIGDSTLTYEELSTVLSQVEACLNSRPISLLSDDPDDPLPLTPGHFLVGEALLNVTDENFSNCNISNLERWRLVQKMVHDIWNRWSNEYLTNLSKRYKWNVNKPEPNVGDIVIIKDDNIPPAKWILGKIIIKHVGQDNVTRVVTVKTKNNTLKRPLSKVIILEK